ncbi:hypothetical protein Mapa_010890 [Marchantia paleacea]|nr:hypothetical protein Mapa_010890 [Marchantia paleacea]
MKPCKSLLLYYNPVCITGLRFKTRIYSALTCTSQSCPFSSSVSLNWFNYSSSFLPKTLQRVPDVSRCSPLINTTSCETLLD